MAAVHVQCRAGDVTRGVGGEEDGGAAELGRVTEAADRTRGQLQHFGRAVERTVDSFLDNAYNVDRKLLLERNRLARLQPGHASYRAVTLYEAVRPGRAACFNAGSYLYFEPGVLDSMYQQGRRAATKWLAGGPVVDHLDEPPIASNA